jgi:hypothetical protein
LRLVRDLQVGARCVAGCIAFAFVWGCGSGRGAVDASTGDASSEGEGGPSQSDAGGPSQLDASQAGEDAAAPNACPGSHPAGPSCSTACTNAEVGANCSYGTWCCICGLDSPLWMCEQTTADPPCPSMPPGEGATCGTEVLCTYCLSTGLFVIECSLGSAKTGQWSVTTGPGHPGVGCTTTGGP